MSGHSLFEPSKRRTPLAERLRPSEFEGVVGQDALLNQGGGLAATINSGRLESLLLWGPPGSGKTTLASLLAERSKLPFRKVSAVFSGVKELKAIFDEARSGHEGVVALFVDEIHRFNRSQQDSFLPAIEEGLVVLIGATTENPSFELTPPLLSRMRVVRLEPLDDEALETLLRRAEETVGETLPLTSSARDDLRRMADGDGRYLLNMAETLFDAGRRRDPIDENALRSLLQKRAPLYDKDRDMHYDLISALHKSVRSSDPDAALYYLARMLEGGEQPLYVARRLIRIASEDVGLADSQALSIALDAHRAYTILGSPEGELALAHAVVYMACAEKSNAAYVAFKEAAAEARRSGSIPPPMNMRNAPAKLMKSFGYGSDYQYDHDSPDAFSAQNCLPDGMEATEFYRPTPRGREKDVALRLKQLRRRRKERNE